MSNPEATGWYSDTPRTKAEMKDGLDLLNDVMAELPGGSTSSDLTIASGAITITRFFHRIETEGAAVTDDLVTITSPDIPAGRLVLLRIKTAGHTVVVKHGAGGTASFLLADDLDFSMTQTDQWLLLIKEVTYWTEVARNYGSLISGNRSYLGLGTAALVDTGTDAGEAVVMAAGPKLPAVDGSDLTGINERGQYLLYVDSKGTGVDGGTFTSLGWRTRDITNEVVDESGAASLASNRITLPAGVYYCRVSCPGFGVTSHKARLYELSATIAQVTGTPEYATTNVQTRSEIIGKFTITSGNVTAGQNIFEVQHYCEFTKATDGFGKSMAVFANIYTIAEFWRIA
jgi:hypothetical protein